MPAHALLEDDYFATASMSTVHTVLPVSSALEEELYTSFEEAISGRVAAVSRQLISLPRATVSATLPALKDRFQVIDTPVSTPPVKISRGLATWKRALVLACLYLSLLLLGFDVMGLLVLSR